MKHAIPTLTNRIIFCGLLGLHLFVLFGMPALHASMWAWFALLMLMVWLNVIHWGLIHEAIHKLLFPDARANEYGGRALAVAMGTSFHALRFGHLMHHQYNRQFHSEQGGDQGLTARAYYYFYLFGGQYLSEVFLSLALFVLSEKQFVAFSRATFLHDYPAVHVAGERFFYRRGKINATRFDGAALVLLYGAAFALAGPQWPWLLAFVAVRAFVISFMDNIYHFGTPADNSKLAKELAVPMVMSRLMLHGNYHETHHANPDVPWPALPATHAAQARLFDGDFVTHGLAQFEGPPRTGETAYAA